MHLASDPLLFQTEIIALALDFHFSHHDFQLQRYIYFFIFLYSYHQNQIEQHCLLFWLAKLYYSLVLTNQIEDYYIINLVQVDSCEFCFGYNGFLWVQVQVQVILHCSLRTSSFFNTCFCFFIFTSYLISSR